MTTLAILDDPYPDRHAGRRGVAIQPRVAIQRLEALRRVARMGDAKRPIARITLYGD